MRPARPARGCARLLGVAGGWDSRIQVFRMTSGAISKGVMEQDDLIDFPELTNTCIWALRVYKVVASKID